jgi:glutamine synthetase
MSDDVKKVLELIKEKDVKYVDFRFTDPRGKWQHTAQHVSTVDEDMLTEGIMFDGSSIAGWKSINESDMILKPDVSTAVMDPFAAQPQLILFCDIVEPLTGQLYDRDPRSIAKRGNAYLESSGLGDVAFFGPEAEFFVFDSVRFETGMNTAAYVIDSLEGPYVSGKELPEGNMGHRPGVKGGYFPVPPVDSEVDLRAEMLTVMGEMGLPIEKHHHEVAPSQHELGCKFAPLLEAADGMQIYKYVVHNVAASYGKTATFMPKPITGDNGSGMHVHQSIWKEGKPLFAGSGYADLSETALY